MESSPANKLRLVSAIIFTGFILALFFHSFMAFFHYRYPWNTFLFIPWDRFMDFFNHFNATKGLNPYASTTGDAGSYFPLAYLLFWPFTFFPDSAFAFIIYIDIFAYFVVRNFQYHLRNITAELNHFEYFQILIILSFLSYPVQICFDRGNMECCVFVLMGCFLIAFLKESYWLASVLLALAAGMKMFPLLFIILLLKEKRFYESAFCILLMVALSVFGLWIFAGSMVAKLQQFLATWSHLQHDYIMGDNAMYLSESLFAFVKLLFRYMYFLGAFSDAAYRHILQNMLSYYSFATFLITGLIALYIFTTEKVLWKQVMLLTTCIILFPVISGDYKLIYLILPLVLFITSDTSDKHDTLYTILFGCLFIPKNYWLLPYSGATPATSYSIMSVLNVIILLFFIGSIINTGLKYRGALSELGLEKLYPGETNLAE